jgi:hypothetical protein
MWHSTRDFERPQGIGMKGEGGSLSVSTDTSSFEKSGDVHVE